jgi:integrase
MTVKIDDSIESYLAERSSELSDSSLQNHRYQLKQFREWAGGAGSVRVLDDIDPIDLSKFRRARSEDINSNTMYNQLGCVRLWLRHCARMGWVEESLPESIVLPKRSGQSRSESIDPDRVAAILDELETYSYASLDHVILSLLWTCSLRIGGLRAPDVNDVHTRDRWIDVCHRPDTDTPLKNKAKSEREINLHGWVSDVLRAWIEDRRPASTDSHSRKPLVATEHGRIAPSSIRERVYSLTDCGGLEWGCDCSGDGKCDESVAPHDIRRSSISAWLDDGTDPSLLSERVDTSKSTMDRHYDVRSPSAKRELRRDAFDM